VLKTYNKIVVFFCEKNFFILGCDFLIMDVSFVWDKDEELPSILLM
jgi:hypothetical protein